MSTNSEANDVNLSHGSHTNEMNTGAASKSVVWSCLASCLLFLYHYFIRACFHFHICRRPEDDSNKNDVEMSNYPPEEEETGCCTDENMKKRLSRHFRSHVEKWTDKDHPRFPWKATLHILLVALVTAQGSIFVQETRELTNYLKDSTISFRAYFTPVTRIYTLDEVYEQITHIVESYYNISSKFLIRYRYANNSDGTTAIPMRLNFKDVDDIECDGGKKLDVFGPVYLYLPTNNDSCDMATDSCCDVCTADCCLCSVMEQVECYINGSNADRFRKIAFHFKLSTYFVRHIIDDYNPVNATTFFTITLKSDLYSGTSVRTELKTTLRRYRDDDSCVGFRKEVTIVDIVVFLILIISSMTYLLSFFLSFKMSKDVKLHFLAVHEKHLRWQELLPLFNKWYILMLFANTLVFVAMICKIISEYNDTIDVKLLEAVRALFGVGLLLLWCSIFGLMIYFEPFNVLFITVTLALPSIIRFLCCIVILFIAFSLCGWLMLSHYHPKFETFWLSVETLFTVLNGDDLYATFESDNSNFLSDDIEILSRIYLGIFVFIFIYAVLSLFIGIFGEAYESLSNDWRRRSRGFLRDWAEGEPDDDPTKNYPFPVPAVRKPADDTNSKIVENTVTVEDVVLQDNSSLSIPVIEVTEPGDDQLHVTSGDDYLHIRSPSRSSRMKFNAVKLQAAEPPSASKQEVNDARLRITASTHRLQRSRSDSES